MPTRQLLDYNGFVFASRETVVIKAKTVDAAKAQMTEKFGPEFDGPTKKWVCGLAPHSLGRRYPEQ